MRLRVVGTAASLLAVAPGVSFALGFGEIQLRSTLNAPLNAEVDLIATPEELANLRTQLAPRDAFTRSGLDYPAFMSNIQVRLERRPDGRPFLRLTSTAPMTEPFATVLVEASTVAGSQLREFTMLFDPPTFAPPAVAAPAPAPVVAPSVGTGDRSNNIVRSPAPAPAPVRTAPPAPAPRPDAGAAGGEYTVRGGDSLSAIARRQYGTGDADRAMIAIFRGNQHAFEGNINRLRAGTVLRLPDNAAVNAVNPAEATAEVRRQAASWRSEVRPATATDPRLVLIPPASPGASGGTSAETQSLRDQVAALEAEVAEKNRLLQLRSEELARLQPATPPAVPATPPAATVEPTPAPVEPAAPVVAPAAPTTPSAPPPEAASVETGPSFMDRLKAFWTDFWYVPVGLVAFLLALILFRAARRRREEAPSDNLAPFDIPAAPPVRDTSSDTFPLRKPLSEVDERSILVEESGAHERPAVVARKDTRTVDLEDTSSSMSVPALDATAALEQGDPLAEADFHMAYGLYDQAADLVRLAIAREPERRDLKLKLLEVFFVWGNKDQFLQTARDLADTRDSAGPGEWEKVVIMGKQLAPEDALFSQSYSGAGPAAVDLNLEGGQNLVDFDLHSEPSVSLTQDGGVDLNTGAGGGDTGSLAGLDFVLDDPARGNPLERTATTRQMVQPGMAASDDIATRRIETDGPTVEHPALDRNVDTLAGKLDAHGGLAGVEQTAELAIDDLGLDLGKFDATGTNATLLDDSQLARALEAAESPTLVSGIDDTSRQFSGIDDTSRQMVDQPHDEDQPTELLPMGDFSAIEDIGATARVSMLDLEFNVDANAETGKRQVLRGGDAGLDLDVGAPEKSGDDEYQRTQPVKAGIEGDPTHRDLESLEPVTMSEVGTKLDLARAYMDMGDPDGARSILREVLQEGSATQRQEAQRLIDSIPG